MLLKDLHQLPQVRDRISFLYVEHARIDQEAKAIAVHDAAGVTPVPCANLNAVLLGPGTNITHAAVLALADNGCLAIWCGEQGVRCYAAGIGTTRNAERHLHQALLCSRQSTRLKVVRRMYALRFEDALDETLSLQQIRGKEGVRVRDAYARAAREWGIEWKGRNYQREQWNAADPANRALSAANSCLYGICHAAIIAAGYAPALGFIHTGKQLSFVYDVADLYKMDLTVPIAFQMAATVTRDLEREVRKACRDAFARDRILERVVKDIDHVLQVQPDEDDLYDFDGDPALPSHLWDPEHGRVEGGVLYADNPDKETDANVGPGLPAPATSVPESSNTEELGGGDQP